MFSSMILNFEDRQVQIFQDTEDDNTLYRATWKVLYDSINIYFASCQFLLTGIIR